MSDADRLREDLAAAKDQLSDVRAQLTVAQAAAATARLQADADPSQRARWYSDAELAAVRVVKPDSEDGAYWVVAAGDPRASWARPIRAGPPGAGPARPSPGPGHTRAAAVAAEPPLRLLLSGPAFDIAKAVYAQRLQTWAEWEDTSRAAG
ncbi:hypothetical protein ACWEPL_40525 [Nonomuraea sp. NPDC004186]